MRDDLFGGGGYHKGDVTAVRGLLFSSVFMAARLVVVGRSEAFCSRIFGSRFRGEPRRRRPMFVMFLGFLILQLSFVFVL